MRTFVNILHKQNAITNELYSVSVSDYKNIFEYVFKYEFKTQINPNDLTVKLLIFSFIANIMDKQSRTYKYQCIQEVFKNRFILQEIKYKLLFTFGKAYKVFTTLNRLVYRWKLTKATPRNDTDLFMNPIHETDKNVIAIFQNEQKFLFSVSDIISLLENALCNMSYYNSKPKIAKNPYNNMAFDKSTLCNIYFFICKKCIKVPPLIQQYFYSGFNLSLFRYHNEFLIRDVFVNKYMKSCDNNNFLKNITDMLIKTHYDNKFIIDKKFPIKKLKKIMTPYVELYIKYLYAFSSELSVFYFKEITRNLDLLYLHNRNFGKKIMDQITKELYISDEHPQFVCYFRNFQYSHLELVDYKSATAFSMFEYSDIDNSDTGDEDEQPIL
jgi:hypothetical protein